MLTSDHNNVFSCAMISPLSAIELREASMCAVNAKFVYVTGGCLSDGASVSSCYQYDIGRNEWQSRFKMRRARQDHSSCQLGAYIYVFCGDDIDGNSVEKLSIDTNTNLQDHKGWELISKRNLRALPRLLSPLSFSLNAHEIVILGGYG